MACLFVSFGWSSFALAEKDKFASYDIKTVEITDDRSEQSIAYDHVLLRDAVSRTDQFETSNFKFFLFSENNEPLAKDDSYLDIIEDFDNQPKNSLKNTDLKKNSEDENNQANDQTQEIDKSSDQYNKTISYYFRGKQYKSPSVTGNFIGTYGVVISLSGLFYNPKNLGYRLRIGYNAEIYQKSFVSQVDIGSFAIYYGVYGAFAKTEASDITGQSYASLGIDADILFIYHTPLKVDVGPIVGLELSACNYTPSWRFCFAPFVGVEMTFAKYFFINYIFKLPLTFDKGTLKHSLAATHSLGIGFKILI